MRFEILGPLRVCTVTGEVTVTAARDRVLLVMLLLHVDRPVSVDQLVDAIWCHDPPTRARNQVQKCVLQLRRLLTTAGHAPEVIVTDPAGYRIPAEGVSLDLLEFRTLVAAARTAAANRDQHLARDRYRAALGLWRGPALAGVDSDPVRAAADALEEQRRQVMTEQVEVELALGGAGELVAELTDLVRQYPYQESLHHALMLALYRAGRQADALAAYQHARTLLVADLGQEPGPTLRELHRRILAGDAALLPAAASAAPATARRCLPRAVGDFTGRAADLEWLLAAAERADGSSGVVAIDGMAGIGKTTLALHAAHRLAPRYPDAQLFIDLHGHSERRPVEPAAALDVLLRQLGIPAVRIPAELDERIALWRSELADRRALVVLDNAATSAQVTPLLAAAAGNLTLVTSRRRLVGLDAASPLSLQVLGDKEAVALLAHVAGDRVGDDDAAALEVVRRCGNLPLAIRLAGARLAHRPSWRVRDLAARLADARGLLGELAAGDRTVAGALELSYAPLHADQQRAFRLLGLHPGEEFDEYAAAALADVSLDESRKALEELVDRHLLLEPRSGRYRFHDLVRDYARQLAEETDSEADRRAAIEGLLDYYLHATATAVQPLEPARKRQRFSVPVRKDLIDDAGRFDPGWMERERQNITAAIRLADAVEADHYGWQIARASWVFFYERSYLDDLLTAQRHGLAAASRLGDDAVAATMHNYLASAYFRIGDLARAIDHLQNTIAIRERLLDEQGAVTARMNLGSVLHVSGSLREGARLHESVLTARIRMGDVDAIGSALTNLGGAYLALGRNAEALQVHRRALAAARQAGDLLSQARALGHLGATRLRLGEPRSATRYLAAALRLKRLMGARDGEGEILNDLAMCYRSLGDTDRAVALHRDALLLTEAAGDRPVEVMVRNAYGRTLRDVGEVTGALEQHRAALATASRIKLTYEHARALDGIAACLRDTDPAEARSNWQQALTLYSEMGVAEQHEVTRQLADLISGNPDPNSSPTVSQ